MKPWLVLLLIPLAGCIGDEPTDDAEGERPYATPGHYETPRFLCFAPLDTDDDTGRPIDDAAATRCNFEMTPDAGRHGNEVTIAVNPTDPRNIVGGAKDYYPADAGDCVWDGIYVTHDGGRSAYQDRSVDGSPWRQLDEPDPSKLNYASQFWCTTDPVTYFDVNGKLYFLIMAYQADPITGSKLGEDFFPLGGLNDWAFNRATQIVATSSDGGDSFDTFTPLFEGTFPVAFNDKGWIAASDDGTIHVAYGLYPSGTVYFRSTDGGETFQGPTYLAYAVPTPISDAASGFGAFLNVGDGPEVYASWASNEDGRPGPGLAFSDDYGATWSPSYVPFTYEPFDIPNGLSPRDRRGLYQWPVMATDANPDSPFAAAIYFAYPAGGNDDGSGRDDGSDIFFRASFDNGATWTDSIRLNDDGPGSYQWMPTMSVSPGGVIDVSWFDQRLDDDNYFLDQYYTYSLDGGATWAPNFRVRDLGSPEATAADIGWDPFLSKHQNGMAYLGDYNGMASSWQAAHPNWPDGRTGELSDVYTATIMRPMFAQGFPDGAREAALQWIDEHPL